MYSAPASSRSSLDLPKRDSTSTSPPPPSKNLPTNTWASLGIWWNNSSYKEARIAEERLLRRMPSFQPSQRQLDPASPGTNQESMEGEEIVGHHDGLVATIRKVFIPTPKPVDAPSHPTDLAISPSTPYTSAASSTSSLSKTAGKSGKKQTVGAGPENGLVDYINTLEISHPKDKGSKEAVVVLHGYAAALGYVPAFPLDTSFSSTGRSPFLPTDPSTPVPIPVAPPPFAVITHAIPVPTRPV